MKNENDVKIAKIREKGKTKRSLFKNVSKIIIYVLISVDALYKMGILPLQNNENNQNNEQNYNSNFKSNENESTHTEEELFKNEKGIGDLILQSISLISQNTILNNQDNMTVSEIITNPKTWEQSGDKWKLKLENDSYARNQWISMNNEWYLFGEDEYMLTGWQKVDKKWYLLAEDGHMLTNWQIVCGKWYYMKSNGEMAIGWNCVDGKWYYMDSTGAMMKNATTPDGYLVNKDGEWMQ